MADNSIPIKKQIEILKYLLNSKDDCTDGDGSGDGVLDFLNEMCSASRHAGDPLETLFSTRNQTSVIPQILLLLRETLVTHRWSEVTKVLVALTREEQRRNTQPAMEALWKASCLVFQNDPVARQNFHHFEKLVSQFKLLSELQPNEVVLQLVFLLMSQGRLQEAQHTIKAPLPKSRKHPTERSVMTDHLMAAYEGLIWYMQWLEEKQEMNKLTTHLEYDSHQQLNYSSRADYEQVMRTSAEKACTCFSKLKGVKGAWDVFITKHVKLLEYYSNVDEVGDVLQTYYSTNPDSPNSHVFLYNHMLATGADQEEKISVLKNLQKLSPSDALMMDLHNLLKQKKEMGAAWDVIFNLLDYSCHKNNLDVWQIFLHDLQESNRKSKALWECWKQRSDWWPPYHFCVPDSHVHDKELMMVKCGVALCLLGSDNEYSKYVSFLSLSKEQ